MRRIRRDAARIVRRCMTLVEGTMAATGAHAEKYSAYQATFRDSVHLVTQWDVPILDNCPRTGTFPMTNIEWINKEN